MNAYATPALLPMPLNAGVSPTISVVGEQVHINEMVVAHREAAGILAAAMEERGQQVAVEMIATALPVGLMAITTSAAALDTGAVARTLDGFADHVDDRASQALNRLENTVASLRTGEAAVTAASEVVRKLLVALPQQVEAGLATALTGGSTDVRVAVAEAARQVQAVGLAELNAALRTHAAGLDQVLTLDHKSPISTMRQELLNELSGVRRELSEQLSGVRALVETTQAVKQATVKSTRATGAAWEQEAMSLANSVVTGAGDLFDLTAGQPGRGTTARTGDGLATLNHLVTGSHRTAIVLEAKHRSKPMSSTQLRAEARKACEVREAAGCLILVPDQAQVPGEGLFARIEERSFVVAANDPDVVALVYLVLREVVAITTTRAGDSTEINADALGIRLDAALTALTEFDEVARLANNASRNLDELKKVGGRCQAAIRTHLAEALNHLRA